MKIFPDSSIPELVLLDAGEPVLLDSKEKVNGSNLLLGLSKRDKKVISQIIN